MNDFSEIYRLAYETLKGNSPSGEAGEAKFNEKVEYWRKYPEKFQKDDDFFKLIVEITFYSGFRSTTVTKKLPEILNLLGNYQEVKNYTFEDVETILKNEKIIANVSKICSTILNAREFDRLINNCGSFKEYLQKFNFEKNGVWNGDTEKLYADLCKRFHYLSDITAYHFLMDIGAFCIKPDRQIVALFKSLGVIDEKTQNRKVVEIGRNIAKETGENIRVVDIVLVTMRQGDEFGFGTPICPTQCEKCRLNFRCRDAKVRKPI